MKKYVMLVLCSMFMFNVATIAQGQVRPHGRTGEKKVFRQAEKIQVSPEKRAERMAVKLGLTNEEKVKVQALFEKQDAKRDQQQAEIKKIREERIAKFGNERKEQDAELEKIIGSDKFQKLENERTDRKSNFADRKNGNQNHRIANRRQNKEYNRTEMPKFTTQNRADKMAKMLGLTDAEKTKVQDLFEKQKTKLDQHLAVVKKVKAEQMDQFETERKSMNADLEKIIGTEKYQKLNNKRTEMKPNLKERSRGNQMANQGRGLKNRGQQRAGVLQTTPEKRAERLAKVLDLNASQKADVQSLFEKQEAMRKQQMEKIEKMRDEMKTQLEAQRKTNDDALAKIVGQEKFQKYQSMRTSRRGKVQDKREMHTNNSPKNNM